jgi:acetylornithine deacetylase
MQMEGITFSAPKFIDLLRKLISETKNLQNAPPTYMAKETLAINHIMEVLHPYSSEAGGPLGIRVVEYVEGRGNVIVQYSSQIASPDSAVPTIAFVGSHLDVVPANPEEWKRDPFTLTVEGDLLFGRGTTDCLGHVALLTILFEQLAIHKPALPFSVVAVFIADEEHGRDPTIGVKHLCDDGALDFIKAGPIYWVDSSDIQPTIGSGTSMGWCLTVTGKRGHSGLPFNAVNPMLIAMDATKGLVSTFNKHFPLHEREPFYHYKCTSNMKPTQWAVPEASSLNQIPEWASVSGDVRVTPFYDPDEVKRVLEQYVAHLNEHLEELDVWHEAFRTEAAGARAKLELKWIFGPYKGVACDITSIGYKLLADATADVVGHVRPYSELGSLPLIAELQEKGLDMQMIGYGVSSVYHGNDEFSRLSDMATGFAVFKSILTAAAALPKATSSTTH